MPLINSATKKAFSQNVSELVGANKSKSPKKKRSMGQILAIAYSEKRKAGGSG